MRARPALSGHLSAFGGAASQSHRLCQTAPPYRRRRADEPRSSTAGLQARAARRCSAHPERRPCCFGPPRAARRSGARDRRPAARLGTHTSVRATGAPGRGNPVTSQSTQLWLWIGACAARTLTLALTCVTDPVSDRVLLLDVEPRAEIATMKFALALAVLSCLAASASAVQCA